MKMIAAVDRNWGIGYRNKLLVHIPEDMKRFQSLTMGKVVVMGRKTLQSLPNGQPLFGRTNLVLTENRDFRPKGVILCHSVDEVLEKIGKYPQDEVFVMGGASIYRQFLEYSDEAYITFIDYSYHADAYFPNLNELGEKGWRLCEESEEQTYFDLEYYFRKYRRL